MAVCIIYCCFCEYIILYRFVVYILKINLLVGCSVLMVILSTIIFPPLFLFSLSWETFILCGSSSNQCLSNSGFPKVLFFIFPSVWRLSTLPAPDLHHFVGCFPVSFTFRTILEIKSPLILENDILLWDLRFTQ